MPEVIDVTPEPVKAAPPAKLTIKQDKFLTAYLQSGNATKAAIEAGYSEASASVIGYENLNKPQIAAELARRKAAIAETIGLTQIALFARMRDQAFCDIRKAVGGPSTWDDATAAGVKHYDAGGPQSSEKVTLYDQPRLLMELNEKLFTSPAPEPPPVAPVNSVTNVQINVDKAVVDLHALFAKHRKG